MAAPKRLPKSKEERDFDKLMRDRRPSVWEDKGSVGDEHFRSLKGAAKLQQGLLPPLAGAGKSEPAAADRAHGADGAAPDAMVAAQRAPRRHGADFDGFMRSTQKKTHTKHAKARSVSVPPALEAGAGGMIPHHIHKLLAQDTPKWHSLAANECGRVFGERNSASLGANLFRHEREAAMQQKMRTVDAVLRAYGGERSDALAASLEASRTMLPMLNPRSSKLKLGAGYIKVDLMAEESGINPFSGVHKPVRTRDAGGISPPINHKARRAKDGRERQRERERGSQQSSGKQRDGAGARGRERARPRSTCAKGSSATC
eukprot:Tamp_07914.p1 GENE.Tamp_07914~~Tamp_07914.p1  ORF type:complete len:340 (-),score=89.92 Tamp_07914:1394-2341(-)